MREIKFRAWLNMQEEMIYADMFGAGEKFAGRDCEIMQYTGLKDKNGKEIYEGDLLKFDKDEDVLFEVFYHDQEARFSCARIHYKGARCGGYVPNIYSQRFEIIGNIYENKDLIK